jgi:hypothetical protein
MGHMIRKLTTTTLVLLLATIFILAFTGCPPAETPEPAPPDTPTGENGDTPPIDEVETPTENGSAAATMQMGPLQDTMVKFFMAMAEMDLELAQTHCTEEFWTSEFEGMEEMLAMFSEEEIEEMKSGFAMDEEMHQGLMDAVAVIDGDNGTLTITDPDDVTTVFQFIKVDGNWLMSSVEE